MSACAGDRAVVEPGDVAVSAAASASASEGWASIHLLEEATPGSILMANADPPPNERYVINDAGLADRMREVYGDIGEVDFLIVLPSTRLSAHYSLTTNRSIAGIGNTCNPCVSPALPQVKNIVALNFHEEWAAVEGTNFDPMNFFVESMRVVLHEIGHYWLMYLENFGTGYPGHYTNTLDLFYGDSAYADPLAYAHWIVDDSSETCVSLGYHHVIPRFSDLSLYLMGFIPPRDVAPITQHEFLPRLGRDTYNALGPRCGEPHKFTKKRVVSIEDIVARYGVRSPSYLESQKDFRAMFIVLHPAGEVPPSGFVKYASAYADSLPAAWASATRGHSTIKVVHAVRTHELQP